MTKNDSSETILSSLPLEDSAPPRDIGILEKHAAESLKEKGLQNKGLQEYYELRKEWSEYIAAILRTTTAFVIIMIIFIGCGLWKFQDYPYFPHSVIASFFGEVIGLCLIITKCLFPRVKL
jgi:hypothetical protein